MKILVVGGAGYIGSHMIKRFQDTEHQIEILDNLSTGFEVNAQNYKLHVCDLSNKDQLHQILKDNNYIGITPDGPRGPNKKVSEGIIKIAVHSQVPIIPLGFASNKNLKLKSWDSFLITYPFSICSFVWGEPIIIPSSTIDDDLDKYKDFLEEKINDCIETAEKNLDA